VQISWVCLAGGRPGACLVPLLLISLLCEDILGLSRRRKARCLIGTPTTVLVSLLCAGILGLSRRRKARCLIGNPTTSISVMCRHLGSVSPAEETVPAWHPYYWYLCYVQASWVCLGGARPGACWCAVCWAPLLFSSTCLSTPSSSIRYSTKAFK
jgi:hypothetical protein